MNLHHATNQVYSVWSTTNIAQPFAQWQVATEVWPTDTNCQPFTVPNSGSPYLFLRAEDWTGVTENGNITPDWWLWLYFGTTALSDTNLDANGNTLVYDYQNGFDPNVITFTINVVNNYVNTSFLTLPLNITAGTPSYYAVQVNHQTTTNWLPFVSSNSTVYLGSTDGVYTVTVGLRGLPANATQTWQSQTYIKDTAPAVLVITNLGSLRGSRPFIDPAGYATKSLHSLTLAVTNSAGLVTLAQGTVFDQDCNPGDMCHATNRFACLDAALTLGTNAIGIQATDWAGNVTTTNFSYVFDTTGDTNPPAIALIWPQNGMEISGNSFTLRGTLDDDTATVAGQWTDSNGVTQTVNGLVERGGQFWLENLPLNPGTNVITLTATDAAGNPASTNLVLTQSGVTLTMDAVDPSLLNQVNVNVAGEVSDPTYVVWVNGVQGTNYGNGTWAAGNVPVTAGGTASFDLTGYPPGYAPTGNSWTNFAVEQLAYPNNLPADPAQANVSWDKPSVVYVAKNKFKVNTCETSYNGMVLTTTNEVNWTQGGGGYSNDNETDTNSASGDSGASFNPANWPGDAGDVPVVPGLGSYYITTQTPYTNRVINYYLNADIGTPNVEWVDVASANGTDPGDAPDDIVPITWTATGEQVVKLFTGGKALRQNKSLFILGQSLVNQDYSIWDEFGLYVSDIASQSIALGSLGNLNANGNVYATLADGQEVVVTPQAPGSWYGGSLPSQAQYTLTHQTECTAAGNTNNDRTTIGIGEVVDLSGMPDGTAWSLAGGGTLNATNGGGTYMASMSPTNGTITAKFKDAEPISVTFTIIAPSGIQVLDHADNYVANGWVPESNMLAAQNVGAATQYTHNILPATVSFAHVLFRENIPAHTNRWPGGIFTYSQNYVYYGAGGACAFVNVDDQKDGLFSKFNLTSGSGFQNYSYTLIWHDEYQNQDGVWTPYVTKTCVTDFNGSALIGQETYQSVPGGAMGPFQ